MPRFLPAALVAALLVCLPDVASATTTVTRAGNDITIVGDDGPNVISVDSVGDGFIKYEDKTGASIVAGDGCAQDTPSAIYCGQGGTGVKATVVLGGGDDTYDDRVARTDRPVADLDAGDGNDTISGSYGADILRGGPGNDTLKGIAANDQIDGGPGDDTIHGGADDDLVVGGPGRDSLYGDGEYSGTTLGGNDTIEARDGETDSVACGFGADTALLDASDVMDVDCESVEVQASGGGGGGGGGTTPGSTGLTVALSKPKAIGLRALARGTALVVSATVSQPCAATLRLTVGRAEARRAKLGRKAVTLASAVKAAPTGTLRASLKIKKAYQSQLRRLKRLKTTLAITCKGASGANAAKAISITLKR
jgi:hemolysin type calcium-binding protein